MHNFSKDYHCYIYLCDFESINILAYFYNLIIKTTYIKLCIILQKHIYKSKTKNKPHENKKINQNYNLCNKKILVESEK